MKRLLASLGLLYCLCSATASSARAEPIPEYAMKAAFLYNFAVFTEWPEHMDGKLNVCTFGLETFSPMLEGLNGKLVKDGLQISVTRIASLSKARQCQILYFDTGDQPGVLKDLEDLTDTPILTISDAMDPKGGDAMIRLRLENNRLTFEVNQQAARRAHLTFSSKMLRLARKIY